MAGGFGGVGGVSGAVAVVVVVASPSASARVTVGVHDCARDSATLSVLEVIRCYCLASRCRIGSGTCSGKRALVVVWRWCRRRWQQ